GQPPGPRNPGTRPTSPSLLRRTETRTAKGPDRCRDVRQTRPRASESAPQSEPLAMIGQPLGGAHPGEIRSAVGGNWSTGGDVIGSSSGRRLRDERPTPRTRTFLDLAVRRGRVSLARAWFGIRP